MPKEEGQSVVIEKAHEHTAYFASRYAQVIGAPLLLRNHTCSILFESHPKLVHSRQHELERYLNSPTNTKRFWGRTIASEIAISMISRSVLAGAFTHQDGRLFLVPTDLDESDYEGTDYHKGFDLLIATNQGQPLLGIDVTIGRGGFVRKKMTHPGIHLGLGIPVTVLPLRGLPFGNEQRGVREYLDLNFREQIKAGGRYNSLANWDTNARKAMETALLQKLIDQLEVTKIGLWGTSDSRVANYSYLSEVIAQIMKLQTSCGRHLIELSGRRSFLLS